MHFNVFYLALFQDVCASFRPNDGFASASHMRAAQIGLLFRDTHLWAEILQADVPCMHVIKQGTLDSISIVCLLVRMNTIALLSTVSNVKCN